MIAKVRIIFQSAMKKREKLLLDALFSCKMQSRGTSEGEIRRQCMAVGATREEVKKHSGEGIKAEPKVDGRRLKAEGKVKA